MTDRSPTPAGRQDEPPTTVASTVARDPARVEPPAHPNGQRVDSSTGLMVQLNRAERRVSARGELDMVGVPVLTDVLGMLVERDPGDSILDMAGLSFIDASGLGCLVELTSRLAARGAKLTLVGVTPKLRRIFDLADLGGLLEQT